jgi:hypothetical protein
MTIYLYLLCSEGLVKDGSAAPRGWSDEEDEEFSSYENSEEGDGDYRAGPSNSHRQSSRSSNREVLKVIEEQFELTLQEYKEEDIGDLEEAVSYPTTNITLVRSDRQFFLSVFLSCFPASPPLPLQGGGGRHARKH